MADIYDALWDCSFNSYPLQGIHISEKEAGFFCFLLDHFNVRAVSKASRAFCGTFLIGLFMIFLEE